MSKYEYSGQINCNLLIVKWVYFFMRYDFQK